jgi:hypothetical protein
MHNHVINTVRTMPASDELAYLSVTSKPEFIVRDYVASKLHLQFGRTNIVAREFNLKAQESGARKKVDLAILDENQKPELFIEFKAGIAEDAGSEKCHPLLSDLCDDLRRIQKIGETPTVGVMTFVHAIGVNTSLSTKIDDSVFKYLMGFKKFENREDMTIAAAILNANKHFGSNGMKIVGNHSLKVGSVWGVTAELHHIFIRPS